MTDLLDNVTSTTESRVDNVKVFAAPGEANSLVSLKSRYDNFIGGTWVPPVKGQYMKDLSPTNGKEFCEVARSSEEDVEPR